MHQKLSQAVTGTFTASNPMALSSNEKVRGFSFQEFFILFSQVEMEHRGIRNDPSAPPTRRHLYIIRRQVHFRRLSDLYLLS